MTAPFPLQVKPLIPSLLNIHSNRCLGDAKAKSISEMPKHQTIHGALPS